MRMEDSMKLTFDIGAIFTPEMIERAKENHAKGKFIINQNEPHSVRREWLPFGFFALSISPTLSNAVKEAWIQAAKIEEDEYKKAYLEYGNGLNDRLDCLKMTLEAMASSAHNTREALDEFSKLHEFMQPKEKPEPPKQKNALGFLPKQYGTRQGHRNQNFSNHFKK